MKFAHLLGLAAAFVAACSNIDEKGRSASSDGGPRATDDANPGAMHDAAPPPVHVDPLDLDARCTSGKMRDPDESEGPEMMPGHACIACHDATVAATGEDAPSFAFGGTAFPSGHEPDDCIASGSEGAVITVTDSAGTKFTATANTVGNFFVEDMVPKFPITATIEFEGRTRSMKTPQMLGDCNSCHTQGGDEAAPGRITLP